MGARSTSVFRAGLLEDLITLTITGDRTLSVYEAQNRSINFVGSPAAPTTITVPLSVEDEGLFWFLYNNTSQALTFASATGGATITLTAGQRKLVLFDAVDMIGTVATPKMEELQVHTTAQPYRLPSSPAATATGALLSMGPAAVVNGSANGNYLGINTAAGFGGTFIQAEVDGANRFIVGATGTVSAGGYACFGAVSSLLGVITGYVASAADLGLVIKGAGSQSGDLLQLMNSSATVLTRFTSNGYLGIGSSPSTTSAIRTLHTTATLTASIFCENVTSIAGSNTVRAGRFAIYSAPTGTDTIVALALTGQAFYRGNSGTQALIAGGDFNTSIDGTPGAAQVVTEAVAVRCGVTTSSASGGGAVTFTNAIGLMVNNQAAGHGAALLSITNSYAIRVKAQSGASTKSWSIVSDGGECQIITGANGTKGLSVVAAAAQTANLFETQNSSGTPQLQITAQHAIFHAGALGIQSGSTTATSIGNGSSTLMVRSVQLTPQNAFQGTSGNQLNTEVLSTFSPTSGSATFQGVAINQTINQTGGANGIYEGIRVAVTETAAAAVFHKLINCTVGAATRFVIGNDGRAYISAPTTAPTDANLHNNSISWWLDEATPAVKARIRKSDGTYLTLTITNAANPTLA